MNFISLVFFANETIIIIRVSNIKKSLFTSCFETKKILFPSKLKHFAQIHNRVHYFTYRERGYKTYFYLFSVANSQQGNIAVWVTKQAKREFAIFDEKYSKPWFFVVNAEVVQSLSKLVFRGPFKILLSQIIYYRK